MTHAMKLSMATLSALVVVGCGGDPKKSTTGTPTAGSGQQQGTALNGIEGNTKERLSYLYTASDLVSGANKKVCHKMDNGHSNTIKWQVAGTEMDIYYNEYSNENCVGNVPDIRIDSAKYKINIGKEINGGKALEVGLQFVSGNDLTKDIPNHILGYDVGSTFYTTAVSAGNAQTQNLVWGVAKPTDAKDGTSANNRATDVSDYSSGKYYFAQ